MVTVLAGHENSKREKRDKFGVANIIPMETEGL